jgi:TolB-like protein
MAGETPESAEGPAPTGRPTTVQDAPSGPDDGAPHASGHVHAHHPLIQFRFFEQLKHRNIIRVGILYLVACWLILDPVHVVFHMLEVPAWANRLVVILLAIGFPVVLLFAWVYEITPEGLKPTVEVDPHRSIRKLTGQRLDRAIMVLLVLGVAYLLVDKLWLSKHVAAVESAASVAGEHGTESGAKKLATAALAPPAASIAVLAFSDLSAEGNQGYFSDGIAEEILNVLAHVNGLKVASRTSSFQFRKSDLGAPAIAQKLGVRHILEGSVRKAGDTVRVTAQLVDASTDHLFVTLNQRKTFPMRDSNGSVGSLWRSTGNESNRAQKTFSAAAHVRRKRIFIGCRVGPVSNVICTDKPKGDGHEVHDADDPRCLPRWRTAARLYAGSKEDGRDGTVQRRIGQSVQD